MKKSPATTTIVLFAAAAAAACAAIALPARSFAAPFSVKLPYAKGQSFVVTQGYNSPPTHIKKDAYALDLTQNGCDAYGKDAVAAASGTAMFVSQEGYDGGYGTEIIVDHGGGIVSRYAHLIPDSITVAAGEAVRQGQAIGRIGDTGLVQGLACAAHPGTHIHFAMDTVNSDGTFSAYDPEPISGYTGMTEGKWYLSDNGEEDDDGGATAATSVAMTAVPAAALVMASPLTPPSSATSSAGAAIVPTDGNVAPSGGVTVSVSPGVAVESSPTSTSTITPTTAATSTDATSDATSTTDISTSTSPDDATSTDEATSTSVTNPTSTPSSTVSAASSSDVLFEQLDDGVRSSQSWYDDNWFELGDGFSGTVATLTLEAAVSNADYLASQVSLQEFKDKAYTAMVREFPISDNAPFTPAMATATFGGLSIPLKPYFYYRLYTYQDWQNRSVIFAGTATTTTGTEMWNNFVYGTGRVEYTAPFFPFIIMQGAAATSTLAPPSLTPPSNIAENFDELTMQLSVSWATSTDPDWPANPLHYQMNYSTSTTLSDTGWMDPAPIPVATGNSYLIGIRALDNYGAVSAAATTTWNFPPGFVQYVLSPQLSYAYQYFTVPSTSTLQSIQLFTANFETGARNIINIFCYLQVFDEYDQSSLGMTPADSGATGIECGNDPVFTFASQPLVLYPDHRYHWVFTASTGNPSTGASTQFYGTAAQTADSPFSDPSLGSARFTVTGDTGVLFSN